MQILRTHAYFFVFLILGLFHAPAFPQTCSGCEIPATVRVARLEAAGQANEIAQTQQDAIKARQLPFGIHKGPAGASNERMLFQMEWVAWYDDDLRMPLWVAYELTKAGSAATVAKRQDCFRRDPRLSDEVASFCEDYDEPFFDRGHMLPANDSKRKQTMMDNGFLFSNMAPQYGNFNRKVWERLESATHKWAITSDGLHIITGAIFDRNNDKERDDDSDAIRMAPRNRVAVPSHFYKILIHRRASGIIDTKSFLLLHDKRSDTNNDVYLGSQIVSIDEIEIVTGIDFFPDMEDEREDNIEAGRAGGLNGWFTF